LIYKFQFTIPKNTPETAKIEKTMRICPGIIHRIEIMFPPGCAALAHVEIYHHTVQMWPSNPETDFASDGETIAFREFYLIDEIPAELIAKMWNEDDTYDHTITIRIGVLPEEAVAPERAIIKMVNILSTILGIE